MVEAQFAPRFTLTSKRFIAPPLQISYRSYTSFVSQSQVEWKQGSSGLGLGAPFVSLPWHPCPHSAMERTLLFFVHGRALHSATMCKDSLDAAQEARALMVRHPRRAANHSEVRKYIFMCIGGLLFDSAFSFSVI